LIVYQFSFVHDYLLGGFLTIQHHPTLVILIGFWRTHFLGNTHVKAAKLGYNIETKGLFNGLQLGFHLG
jgi:hypothetical protein